MNTGVHVSFWNLLYDAGNPKFVLFDNLEGWSGEEGEREVQEGGAIRIPMTNSGQCLAGTITIL